MTTMMDKLQHWYKMNAELKVLRENELALRKEIFGSCFPSPKEGVNTMPLDDGYVLKGTHTISRELDLPAFTALRQEFHKALIIYEDVTQVKVTLKLAGYRQLTEEQMKLFDRCLIIKPGSPSMEIVMPKRG